MHHDDVARVPQSPAARRGLRGRSDIAVFALACALYTAAIGVIYTHDFVFVCRDSLPAWLCGGLSGAVPRALSVAALLGLFLTIRPEAGRRMADALRPRLSGAALGLMLAGWAVILLPWLIHAPLALSASPSAYLVLWLGGLASAAAGFVAALWRPADLRAAVAPIALPLGVLTVLALLLPDLARGLQPFWKSAWVADMTFETVIAMLVLLGQDIVSDYPTKMIGIGDFQVLVGPQCSGVEGLALMTVFLSIYILLFRDQLRLGRALWLFPVGLLASWTLNSVRIAVLLLIGRYVSPDLAVEGFHSHAGWLMFMVLSLSLAAGAHRVRWLRRADDATRAVPRVAGDGFFTDPATVMILPFAVFMASATVTSAISETPAILYPWRMAAVAVVLALGWPLLRALPWRIDGVALGTGALCGVLWLATAPPPAVPDAALAARLAAMPSWMFAGWVAARLLGTAVVVPVVEELVFRGYVMGRIAGLDRDRGARDAGWMLVGVVLSTALFAALHDRWLAGALAGLLFAAIYLRRRNLTDAILCHAAANAVIAGWALWQQDFSLI